MNKDLGTLSYMKSFINTTPFKRDKNDRSRFLGEGINYKAKLIGILEVSEARGDRMCQEALADLKMAIRAAGEHKQRININIAIDGLRLRDEKTGDCLYHHPVHKISFIAQDMTDSRAFGYIFGSPDTGHRFFGIKTDKAASQVVISMRDLFQVVFDLKKKEIEMAKQHIEQHQMKYSFPLDSHLSASTNSSGNVSSTTKGSDDNFKKPESPKNSFDVFTDLDPLGTGRSRPYVDKKDFFQDLKNPPKKLLKDLVGDVPVEAVSPGKPSICSPSNAPSKSDPEPDSVSNPKAPSSVTDPFLDDPFDKDPFTEDFSQNFIQSFSSEDPFDKFADFGTFDSKKSSSENLRKSPSIKSKGDNEKPIPLKVSLPPEKLVSSDSTGDSPSSSNKVSKLQKNNSISGTSIKLPSPKQKNRQIYSQISNDSFSENFISSTSPGFEMLSSDVPAPEPPPRKVTSSFYVKPPPLPPKKMVSSSLAKPPARPPPSDYDYIENYQSNNYNDFNSPPLPTPARKPKTVQKDSEYYLQPFPLLPPPNKKSSPKNSVSSEHPSEAPSSPGPTKSLDITLSQLTKTGLSDLAASLNMSPTSLSKMTLQELTRCLSNLSTENKRDVQSGEVRSLSFETKNDNDSPEQAGNEASFSAEFDAHFGNSTSRNQEESLFDKYAVFRELVEEEQMLARNSQDSNENAPLSGDSEQLNSSDSPDKTTQSISEETFFPQKPLVSNPSEDRYAALRDICIDDVILENDDAENSDKEESVVEVFRLEEDTDLLTSHPHSESTDSPTITTKEPQSVMETTIIEEDVSALEADDDEVPDEVINDVLSEQEGDKPEAEVNIDSVKVLPCNEVICPSPKSENLDVKTSLEVESCSATSWAKFDTADNTIQKPVETRADGNISPWSAESKDNDISPTYHEKKKYPRLRRQKIPGDDDDDDREEHWPVRMEPRSWSPSWRENGWSDADSLCDDVPPYVRDYHFSWKGRRRRVSPWNSREQSPWEEDDHDLSEDQWEDSRWLDEGRQQRPRFKGPPWEDERRRHYEDVRKARKQIPWSSDVDRKSSRESLAWEEEERFAKWNYMDRRHRKWDDEGQSRYRRWRERDRMEPGKKSSSRYYRDRSHDHQWDDNYIEPSAEDINHWPQRPRSCDRSRRQYGTLHSSEMEFTDRRYARPPREEYCADNDYRRRAQTLQLQKSRRKHNTQTSPFEDDFTSSFSFSKDANFSGSCSDVFEGDIKSAAAPSESCSKHPASDSSKPPEYAQFGTSSNVREEEVSSKSTRCCQQSPFEDDFTPPATRRCSGRSVSSDMSDTKSGDDVFYGESKESFKVRYDCRRPRTSGADSSTSSRGMGRSSGSYAGSSQAEGSRGKVLSKEREVDTPEPPQYPTDKKISNLKRTDSNSSLKKSESVNIFARNRDPFDDDFFYQTSSQSSEMDKGKKGFADSSKWTDAFN